jgi:hypothetical protein
MTAVDLRLSVRQHAAVAVALWLSAAHRRLLRRRLLLDLLRGSLGQSSVFEPVAPVVAPIAVAVFAPRSAGVRLTWDPDRAVALTRILRITMDWRVARILSFAGRRCSGCHGEIPPIQYRRSHQPMRESHRRLIGAMERVLRCPINEAIPYS